MASLNQQDVWSDFEARNCRHSVKSYTVDKLKQIIAGLTEQCGAQIPRSGKKQELIDRITGELDKYRFGRMVENWRSARAVLEKSGHLMWLQSTGFPHFSYLTFPHNVAVYRYTNSGQGQTFTASHNFAHNNVYGSAYAPPRPVNSSNHSSGGAGGSSIARYDAYAPPRRPIPMSSAPSPARTHPGVPIRFKSTPFYRVDQAVSSVVECPESTGSIDRRSQILQFSLTQEHINKLTQPGSKFQLRLYCTTNTFYVPSPTGFRSNTLPCPIEFPATCEVRVNNNLLQANLKGIKKKPGTAPPADLSKHVRMNTAAQNRVDMVYVNSQANTGPKKFYMIVFLVEISTVEQLVDRLRKGKFRTLEEVKAQMVNVADSDDEIVIGKQKMSLKCPLSYTRITVACRSEKCVHPQCFDAYSWYSVMEQTTTWLCPVCEKLLSPEELIVDGYFGNILDQLPESVEEVEVEPDGEWHTGDNKYGSSGWMDAHRVKTEIKTPRVTRTSTSNSHGKVASLSPPKTPITSTSVPKSASRSLGEVVILDSDSDDEGRVKKELSPTNSASFTLSPSKNNAAPPSKAISSSIIDLTLDSDDEDFSPTILTSTAAKRKASDALDQTDETAYKKVRAVDAPRPTVSRKETGDGYLNGGTPAAVAGDTFSRTLPPPLPRQVSTSSMSNHRSPSSANSPPAAYYASRSLPPAAESPRQFIVYNGYNQAQATNGHSAVYNEVLNDIGRLPPRSAQTSGPYNQYFSRTTGSNGTAWP